MIKQTDKFFIAGHKGLVGSAITRALQAQGYTNLVLRDRSQLELTNQQQVNHLFATEKPDHVVLAAAKVGGIHANNTYRGEFIYSNLIIQANVLEAARIHGTKRLLFLGSTCIYPRACPQPMKEEHLLTGPLETTNEPYAIAKIAGIKMCEAYNTQYGTDFISVMPTNLYGINDNFNLETAHVLPALIRKVHEAKLANTDHITVWGTGQARREFLHVDDMASACLFMMKQENVKEMVNIGSGEEVTIRELAETICDVVGYKGKLQFDTSKPDGSPRKFSDISRLKKLGWEPKISLREGLRNTYEWFLKQDTYKN